FPGRLIELSARQAPRRVEIHHDDAPRPGRLRTGVLETAGEERLVGPTARCQEQPSENGKARQQPDVNHGGSSKVFCEAGRHGPAAAAAPRAVRTPRNKTRGRRLLQRLIRRYSCSSSWASRRRRRRHAPCGALKCTFLLVCNTPRIP